MRIPTRGSSEARSLAITKGKVAYTQKTEDGVVRSVQLQKHVFNRAFFKRWTPGMAYVLGVIYTDGNLHHSSGRDFRVSVSQKEPELLNKVRALLGSNARLLHTKKTGIRGEIHTLNISDEEVYYDLCRLGLTPRKSRDMLFPKVPSRLVRHFIRGCWDGDGTVYFGRTGPRGGAGTIVSGSMVFVRGMVEALCKLGLPAITIYHEQRGSGAWYIRYRGKQCATLSHVLYDGVDEAMYLSRKHARFQQIAEYYQGEKLLGEAKEPLPVPLHDGEAVPVSSEPEVPPELAESMKDREEDRKVKEQAWKAQEKDWKVREKARRARERLRFNLPEEHR